MNDSASNNSSRSLQRVRRIAFWGGVAIIATAYGVFATMKCSGLLSHESWLKLILGPIVLAALPYMAFFTSTKKMLLWWSVIILAIITVVFLDSIVHPR
jgi:hypothetical protein